MKEYDSKSAYDNIVIPVKLHDIVDKSIKKAQRAKKYVFIKPVSAAAALILIFILSVNVSPVFADLLYKVPGLSNIVELVKFDKGLKSAAEAGYVQKVEESALDQGIKFTVKEIIFDQKRLIVYYRFDSSLNAEDLNLSDFDLTDDMGNQLKCFSDLSTSYDNKFKVNKYKEGIIDFKMPGEEGFPENIVISLKSFKEVNEQGQNINTINGSWVLPVKLDSNMLNKEPKVIKYNKTAQIGPMRFNIKNIRIYPCSVYIDVEMDKNNPYKFCGFINPRLVDKNGNEYRGLGSLIESYENRVLFFESNYFIDSRSLKLVFDGIFYIQKGKQVIEFDLKNNRILKDPGYGLEFLYAKEEYFPDDNGKENPAYVVAFKIKDKEIIENMKRPGALFGGIDFGKIYDNNGKVYESGGSGTHDSGNNKAESIERFIYINNLKTPPDILNVEVTECAKGTVDELSLKLK